MTTHGRGASRPRSPAHPIHSSEAPQAIRAIPLTRGYAAIVDATDFEWLSQWKWRAEIDKRGNVYAARSKGHGAPRGMHQLIMGPLAKGLLPDHKNGNTLDNRRLNLRAATYSQNAMNKRIPAGLSGFRGVSPKRGRWMAKIRVAGRHIYLGMHATAAEAARAYDAAARRLHGEFAHLNFPTEVAS